MQAVNLDILMSVLQTKMEELRLEYDTLEDTSQTYTARVRNVEAQKVYVDLLLLVSQWHRGDPTDGSEGFLSQLT